jgi:hypothetical protein
MVHGEMAMAIADEGTGNFTDFSNRFDEDIPHR